MKLCIGRHFEFEASHYLPGENYGKCQNLHGHRYELDILLSGKLQSDGLIYNFHDLNTIINENVIKNLDHCHLNNIIKIPSVENVSMYIYEKLCVILSDYNLKIIKIKLYETKNCYSVIIA